MFARYFVELPIEPEAVERALADAPATLLGRLASEANHRGDALLADVGFGERVRVARQVALELGAPVHASGKTVLPLRWTPMGPQASSRRWRPILKSRRWRRTGRSWR